VAKKKNNTAETATVMKSPTAVVSFIITLEILGILILIAAFIIYNSKTILMSGVSNEIISNSLFWLSIALAVPGLIYLILYIITPHTPNVSATSTSTPTGASYEQSDDFATNIENTTSYERNDEWVETEAEQKQQEEARDALAYTSAEYIPDDAVPVSDTPREMTDEERAIAELENWRNQQMAQDSREPAVAADDVYQPEPYDAAPVDYITPQTEPDEDFNEVKRENNSADDFVAEQTSPATEFVDDENAIALSSDIITQANEEIEEIRRIKVPGAEDLNLADDYETPEEETEEQKDGGYKTPEEKPEVQDTNAYYTETPEEKPEEEIKDEEADELDDLYNRLQAEIDGNKNYNAEEEVANVEQQAPQEYFVENIEVADQQVPQEEPQTVEETPKKEANVVSFKAKGKKKSAKKELKEALYTDENLNLLFKKYFGEVAGCFTMNRGDFKDKYGIAPYNKVVVKHSEYPDEPDTVEYVMLATKAKLKKFCEVLVDVDKFINHQKLYPAFIELKVSGVSLQRMSEKLHTLYNKLYKDDFVNDLKPKANFDNVLFIVSSNYIMQQFDFNEIFVNPPEGNDVEAFIGYLKDLSIREKFMNLSGFNPPKYKDVKALEYLNDPNVRDKFTNFNMSLREMGFKNEKEALYIMFIESIKDRFTTDELREHIFKNVKQSKKIK
jgi:hypothetical protein